MLSTSGLPIKIKIRGHYVELKENLQNGWIKKDGVNVNLISYDCTQTLHSLIDFAFSPRLIYYLVTEKFFEDQIFNRKILF